MARLGVAATGLAGAFGGLALGLACLGIYGVSSHTMRQRRREIAIRMALGARPSDVRRLVFRHGLIVTVGGVCLGIAGAFAAAGLIRSHLYSTSAVDPVVLVGGSTLMGMLALLAAYLPAARASRTDPVATLKEG